MAEERLIKSPWRVTVGANVLLDFTDYVEAEPEIMPMPHVETSLPLRAAFAHHFPRGNVSHTLSFTRAIYCETLLAARNLQLQMVADFPWITDDQATCVIQVDESGVTATLANAVFPSGGFRVLPLEGGLIARFAYQILGGQLTIT